MLLRARESSGMIIDERVPAGRGSGCAAARGNFICWVQSLSGRLFEGCMIQVGRDCSDRCNTVLAAPVVNASGTAAGKKMCLMHYGRACTLGFKNIEFRPASRDKAFRCRFLDTFRIDYPPFRGVISPW